MYPSDEYGLYKSGVSWVDAWGGGGPYVSGYCVCELREYEDGKIRVHRSKSFYIKDRPKDEEMHAIFMIAQKYLMR